jgi:hypothetical protein
MSRLFQLFSQPAASPRAWNIALRSAHIVTMGVLLGGHAYDVAPERLYPALWACLATGLALSVLEAGLDTLWFHQLRGLFTIAKLLLLALVPVFWDHRMVILVAVTVIASVGSHMPARFRYYSVLERKVIRTGSGPGAGDQE